MLLNKSCLLLVLLLIGCSPQSKTADQLKKVVSPLDASLNLGMEVVALKTGKIIYSHNANRYFVPASSEKLLTALAALAELGQEFRFKTEILEDSQNNLHIHFGGDPVLTQGDLFNIFKELKIKFPNKVFNNIQVDLNDRKLESIMPGWMVGDTLACYGAPVNRAILNRNCSFDKDQVLVAVQAPKLRAFIQKNLRAAIRFNRISFKGKLAILSADKQLPVLEKNLLLSHQSPALYVLLYEGLKDSDNLIMEAIFMHLVEPYVDENTHWRERGEPIKKILAQYYGVDLAKAMIIDGSGLTRYNLITAHQFTEILASAYQKKQLRPELLSLLPIAGVDGSLAARMQSGKAKGNIRAKTGSMTGIISLVGFLETSRGEPLAFSILMNNYVDSADRYRDLQDRLCEIMAE